MFYRLCTNSKHSKLKLFILTIKTRWYPWGIQRLVSAYSNRQNPKCQDLPKFQFSGGGHCQVKTQSAKICLNFNGGGRILSSQNSKCLNFNFGGWGSAKSKLKVPRSPLISIFGVGGVLDQISEQGVLPNLSINSALPLSGSLCITDIVSYMWRLINIFYLFLINVRLDKNGRQNI